VTAPFRGSTSGETRQRLRAARYQRLRRDVYVLAPAEQTTALSYDALVTVLPDAVASHHTAAQLLRLPVDSDGLLHVVRSPASPVSRQPGVRTHRSALLPGDVVERDGRRMTSPERTYLDLAPRLQHVPLVVLADAVARQVGLPAIERRVAIAHRCAGCDGRRRRWRWRTRSPTPPRRPAAD
jgi:hypothetical protein